MSSRTEEGGEGVVAEQEGSSAPAPKKPKVSELPTHDFLKLDPSEDEENFDCVLLQAIKDEGLYDHLPHGQTAKTIERIIKNVFEEGAGNGIYRVPQAKNYKSTLDGRLASYDSYMLRRGTHNPNDNPNHTSNEGLAKRDKLVRELMVLKKATAEEDEEKRRKAAEGRARINATTARVLGGNDAVTAAGLSEGQKNALGRNAEMGMPAVVATDAAGAASVAAAGAGAAASAALSGMSRPRSAPSPVQFHDRGRGGPLAALFGGETGPSPLIEMLTTALRAPPAQPPSAPPAASGGLPSLEALYRMRELETDERRKEKLTQFIDKHLFGE
jgi:hypothetical protein